MHTRTSATAAAASLLLAACSQATPPKGLPQPARPRIKSGAGSERSAEGAKSKGPPKTAAAASHTSPPARPERSAAGAKSKGRPIDRESARTAARSVPGVRSVAWLDRNHLLVRVDSNARRSHQLIDEVCYQLQPLGDTLAVVVNVQSTAARTPDELDTLSRNCQLAPGDRALLQRERQLDVLDPAIRAQYRANAEHMRAQDKRRQEAGDRAALEAIPEM